MMNFPGVGGVGVGGGVGHHHNQAAAKSVHSSMREIVGLSVVGNRQQQQGSVVETRKYRNEEIWKYGNVELWKPENVEMRKCGNVEM